MLDPQHLKGLLLQLKTDQAYEAYQEIYRLTSGIIHQTLKKYLDDDEDAILESLSETFATLWEQRATAGDKHRPLAWLIQIGRNKAIDLYRFRKRRIYDPLKDGMDAATGENAQSGMERDEFYLKVFQLSFQLPDRYRRIFIARNYEDLSIQEIAEQEGIKRSAVSNLIKRANKSMKLLCLKNGIDIDNN